MAFRDKLLPMKKQYIDTEEEMLTLLKIIPFERNPSKVYSPRLVAILQGIGPQIDGMMKLLVQELNLRPANTKFPTMFAALNPSHMLSKQKVALRDEHDPKLGVIRPFQFPNRGASSVPAWWVAYNKVKHDLLDGGIYQGTIKLTLTALAGLCVLHHIAHIILLTPYPARDMLDFKKWIDLEQLFRTSSFRQCISLSHGLVTETVTPLQIAEGYCGMGRPAWKSGLFYYLTSKYEMPAFSI